MHDAVSSCLFHTRDTTAAQHNTAAQRYSNTQRDLRAMMTSAVSLFGAAGVVACCCSCTNAFVPFNAISAKAVSRTSVPAQGFSSSSSGINSRRMMMLSAEKKEEEEQEPMDLDLEQMFEVGKRVGMRSHVVKHT